MTSISIPPSDPAYPPDLLVLGSEGRAPPTIWVRGRLPRGRGVAIVGTRAPCAEAVAFTRALASALARAGIAVWSGGAIGIDAAAHEAALDAGGITALVAAGGLDRPYPREHADLFQRVVELGGALIARVPDGTAPMPALFLARNAVLAALTQVTVVVQAGVRSGARSTAAAARRLGRTLCVVPNAPWDPRGLGCAIELARGAQAIASADDLIAALGRPPPMPSPRRSSRKHAGPPGTLPLPGCANAVGDEGWGPLEIAVLELLGDAPMHVDEVCEASGQPSSAAVGALLTLTLRAVVVEGPAGFFRRVSGSPDRGNT